MTASMKIGTSVSSLVDIPTEPTSITWGLQDISAADAGRVQDANNTMYKDRVGQKRKLTLSWTNPTFEQASQIVQAFNNEYVFVRYMDLLAGGWYTGEFYVGDRSAPYRELTPTDATGKKSTVSTLTFDIIER